MKKTYQSAVVLIPPDDVHEPIQAIRRLHDPQMPRWMPHVTLLYPFWPLARFAEASERLAAACAALAPLQVELPRFGTFRHRGHGTLWLAPEPRAALVAVQSALQAAFPDCAEQSRFPGGFCPHLSVGRFDPVEEMEATRARLQADWQPLSFRVERVALIARPVGGPFAVQRWFALGASTAT
jgi:poly(A) polymerase